jgi:hypothetical protein
LHLNTPQDCPIETHSEFSEFEHTETARALLMLQLVAEMEALTRVIGRLVEFEARIADRELA